MSNQSAVIMINAPLFTRKPPPFKIYSGKDFIKDLSCNAQNKGVELAGNPLEENELIEDEENYNLYFSGSDIF